MNDSGTKGDNGNFSEKIFGNKKLRICIIAFLIVIVFVILFCNFKSDNKTEYGSDETASYVKDLESRLSDLLSSVEGAGKVKVAITVASGRETVLAMKKTETITDSGTERTEMPVTVNGKTVTIKELNPEITGVLIVARGAGDLRVLTRIQQATASLLDIDINRIEILTMK